MGASKNEASEVDEAEDLQQLSQTLRVSSTRQRLDGLASLRQRVAEPGQFPR